MKEKEILQIADCISQVVDEIKQWQLPEGKEERAAVFEKFRSWLADNKKLAALHREVIPFCLQFPVPGIA